MTDPASNLFYGRSDELKSLYQAWLLANEGQQQWVTLVAETGTGKTRLVHELYRYISDAEYRSQQGTGTTSFIANKYWPNNLPIDGECLKINPAPELFENIHINECSELPWLWWGIRGIQSGMRNRTESLSCLRDALPHLQPHIAVLAAQRLRFESNREVAIDIGKKAANLLSGGWLDPLITVCELVQNGKAPLQRLFGKYGIELQEQQIKAKVELQRLLLDSLGRFLNEGVPVILVLDDCQWMDRDTIDFLSQLIIEKQGKKNKLMIITTCWAREWTDSLIADLFNQFSGNKQSIALGRIGPKNAREYVHAFFPNLIEDDVDLLLSRADGNMRYLRELCLTVKKDARNYFERNADLLSFTNKAKLRLEDKELDMDRLIESRFLELNEHCQIALERCSYQGERFDPKITQQIADILKDDSINTVDAVREAESPGAMVLAIEQELWEFLQGPYWRLIHKRFRELDGNDTVIAAYRDWINKNLDCDHYSRGMEQLVRVWASELVKFNVRNPNALHNFTTDDEDQNEHLIQEVRLRFWLLKCAINNREYRSALDTLNRLAQLYSLRSAELFNLVTPANAYLCLSVMNQYPFFVAKYEKNGARSLLFLLISNELNRAISGFIDSNGMLEKEVVSNVLEWSRSLYLNKRYCGHMHDIQGALNRLIGVEKKAISYIANEDNIALREQYVFDALRLCELMARNANTQDQWQRVFDEYMDVHKVIIQLPQYEIRDIFWALFQIDILVFGDSAKNCFPSDTDWGDIKFSFERSANIIGNILAFLHDENEFVSFDAKYSSVELEAIVYAGTLISEFALAKGFALAIEFNDRLDLLVRAILAKHELGGCVSLDLVSVCLDMALATAGMQERARHINPQEAHHSSELPDALKGRVIECVISSRKVENDEYLSTLNTIINIGQRYLSQDFVSVDLITLMARAKILLVEDSHSARLVFEEILAYVPLIADNTRASYGEQTLIMPHLVWFFDRWLDNQSESATCWLSLRNSYSDLSDDQFSTLVAMIRFIKDNP